MKIIEALKAQKRTADKIQANNTLITKYCSKLDIEKPYFESDEEQRREVQKLLQSNNDLIQYYLRLKRCIDYTNLKIIVEIDGDKYCITDLLNLKRYCIRNILNSYNSLNDKHALERLNALGRVQDTKTVTIDRFYDEKLKNENIRKWQELFDTIDSRLEVVNATTDLIEDF